MFFAWEVGLFLKADIVSSFNPYHVWLELSDSITAPTYFQLLGLEESEEDPKTVAAAADRAASRVRRCRPGEHASEWAALLDQIAEAKKCLTDSKRRTEYLRSLSGKPQSKSRPSATSKSTSPAPAKPSRIALDPNMYPPGLAPDIAPSMSESRGASSESRPSRQNQSAPPVEIEESIAPMDEDIPPESSQERVPIVPSTDEAMQPYALPTALPMSPAGVPYLQPLDSSSLPDPMRPVAPAASSYAPLPPEPPMAPPTLDFGGAMAPLPGPGSPIAPGSPMAPVALAIPAAQALPVGGGAYPMATAIPAPLNPHTSPFPDPVTLNNAASSVRPKRNALVGPMAWVLTAGIVLLAFGCVYFYVSQTRGGDTGQVANVPEKSQSPDSSEKPAETPAADPPAIAVPAPVPAKEPDPEAQKKETSSVKNSEPKSDTDPSPPPPAPTENKPADKPEKSSEPTKTEAKPATDPKPMPAPEAPEKTDDLPKLTKEDLAKLERAMTRARKAIGDHEFDRAEALLSVASELPRLPEHQAMLDRLKLLSQSVRDYRKAIQESIGKLTVGSTFEVSDNTVAVVEVSPEKIIIRVNGQNRAYMIRELPFGLATALAGQSIPEDDPNMLTLKGAYVMASSRVTPEELKKAWEFLEKASGSVEAAKELLKIFDDKYELGGASEK